MAYIAPADLRLSSIKWFAKGIEVDEARANDAALTDAIKAASEDFDYYTDDHFEPETTSVIVIGSGTSVLEIPKRTKSVTSVTSTYADGSTQVELAAVYRLHSSLDSTGLKRVGNIDALEIISGRIISSGHSVWVDDLQFTIAGTFSWGGVPEQVKRAIALMVWDKLFPVNANQRRAERWSSGDADYLASRSQPTGLKEVDDIIASFRRGY